MALLQRTVFHRFNSNHSNVLIRPQHSSSGAQNLAHILHINCAVTLKAAHASDLPEPSSQANRGATLFQLHHLRYYFSSLRGLYLDLGR